MAERALRRVTKDDNLGMVAFGGGLTWGNAVISDIEYGMSPQKFRIDRDGEQYIGKRVLVGISYVDASGHLLRQEQFHGLICQAGNTGIVLERNDTHQLVSLPPEIVPAEPGEYRLRTTGEVVIDPDFLAQWKRAEPSQ